MKNPDPEEVRLCLGHEQDANSVCSDSLLSYASGFGQPEIVNLLLCGRASIHFIAPGTFMAPIHTAAFTSPAILQVVLLARGGGEFPGPQWHDPFASRALCWNTGSGANSGYVDDAEGWCAVVLKFH